MANEQLDLLYWQPAPKVIVFPLRHRANQVRRVAETIGRKNGQAGTAYWRQTMSRTRNELVALALTVIQIDEQLRQSFDAVQAELIRLTYRGQRPGGAA